MITMVTPDTDDQSVSVFMCFVSGVSSFAVDESMCAIFPTWVLLPVPVTITTPLPS